MVEPPAAEISEAICGKVGRRRAMDDGAFELGRFQHILAAMGHQRAADKGDGGQSVEQAKLADSIGDIDRGLRASPVHSLLRKATESTPERGCLHGDLGRRGPGGAG